MPYTNAAECWNLVLQASKHAWYLGLVDPAAFVDRKHPETPLDANEEWEAAAAGAIEVEVPEVERDLPAFPEPPRFRSVGLARAQRYHLEVVHTVVWSFFRRHHQAMAKVLSYKRRLAARKT